MAEFPKCGRIKQISILIPHYFIICTCENFLLVGGFYPLHD